MRWLVACHSMVASGGLLRFERIGAAIAERGHTLAFLTFGRAPPEFQSAFPVLRFEDAAKAQWDAVFIPGAGFPSETIAAFERLRTDAFGVRVQMILNDQTRRDAFAAVNAAFEPDLVVFNNEHWPHGSYGEFRARAFHQVIGAVDTKAFAFTPRTSGEPFVIGAQISKNPQAILAMLKQLPGCMVRFFGVDRQNVMANVPVALSGRVQSAGPVFAADLAAYYRDIDTIVSPETFAGWANIVAEAMAAGVPVVTTPAGTLSIAIHEETALVVDKPNPGALASAVLRLKADPALGGRLARAARARIEAFDWRDYSAALLKLVSEA